MIIHDGELFSGHRLDEGSEGRRVEAEADPEVEAAQRETLFGKASTDGHGE